STTARSSAVPTAVHTQSDHASGGRVTAGSSGSASGLATIGGVTRAIQNRRAEGDKHPDARPQRHLTAHGSLLVSHRRPRHNIARTGGARRLRYTCSYTFESAVHAETSGVWTARSIASSATSSATGAFRCATIRASPSVRKRTE